MRFRHVLAGLLAAAAALLAQAGPAAAAGNYYQVQGYASATSSDPGLSNEANISASRTRIWLVPGSLFCTIFGSGTNTWCGALNNGTSTLTVGFNYKGYDRDGVLHNYWLRLDEHSNGTCTVRSDMTTSGLICRGLASDLGRGGDRDGERFDLQPD